jgi:hypothetical protein
VVHDEIVATELRKRELPRRSGDLHGEFPFFDHAVHDTGN